MKYILVIPHNVFPLTLASNARIIGHCSVDSRGNLKLNLPQKVLAIQKLICTAIMQTLKGKRYELFGLFSAN